MASPIGIFDDIATNSDLFSTWMRRNTEVQTLVHQPYADLLLDNVVWPEVLAKKDAILAALKEKCKTAMRPDELAVPIWSFSHVHDFPKKPWQDVGGPPHHFALERGDKDALKMQQIHDNGWRPTVTLEEGEEGDETVVLPRKTVYNIIKKTDFCYQLAARFGGSFTVTLITERVAYETDPSGNSFTRHQMSLMLNYFPWGLPEHHENKRQLFTQKFALRERRKLDTGEKLIFWKGESIISYGPPPPPPPAPRAPCPPRDLGPSPNGSLPLLSDGWSQWAAARAARGAGSGCHCYYGCESDSEAE